MATTIVIADDHDIIRTGIKNILRGHPEYDVVGEATDGEEVVQQAQEHQPDILLLDISMPKFSGLDAIEQVRYVSPKTKILIITVHKSNAYVMKAFEAGVKGYLQKENAGEDLLPALAKVAAGEVYLTANVSTYLVERAIKKSTQKEPEGTLLTNREREILRLVAEGKTAKEISRTLFISQRTVENYKNTLLKKLNLERTSDLIKYAIKHRIVELEEY
ncbi:MAG: response regulator transcription factor [Candidatus Omnitrophota bacterium]